MPEVLLAVFVLGICFSPQILAYKFAQHLGRDKWFWFWISFLLPFISLLILMFLPDLHPYKYTTDKKNVPKN
jgi:hypothetical protein